MIGRKSGLRSRGPSYIRYDSPRLRTARWWAFLAAAALFRPAAQERVWSRRSNEQAAGPLSVEHSLIFGVAV